MQSSYRAMPVTTPGSVELVTRPTPLPGKSKALIAVEACGICGADTGDIMGADPALSRVPGHEVVGRIVLVGEDVPKIWTPGQRVGIGRLGGHCNACRQCRQGGFQLCEDQHFVGATWDGGYAEMRIARATGLVAIPDELGSKEAAPILCAGLATFTALKTSGAEAGDTVAILGIGGLAPRRQLILLGAGKDPLSVQAGQLVVGERGIAGSITGTPYDNERTLQFSVLADVRPQIACMPLERAEEVWTKVKSGDVKFRMVLTMPKAKKG